MALSVVLDTNILLVSISSRSPHHWLFQALFEERFDLLLTHYILLEYEEIIGQHMSAAVAADVLTFLRIAPNARFLTRYFRWQLVEGDPDDDKFVDCAIAGRADGIVTHDRHFDVLRGIGFPYVRILRLDEFEELLAEQDDD